MNKIIDKTSGVILKIITIIAIALFALLSLMNIIGTTYIDDDRNWFGEYAYFELNNYLIIIVLAVLFLAIIFAVDRIWNIEQIDTKKIQKIATIYVIIVGAVWLLMILAYPVADQRTVQNCALQFIDGNYESLENGGYLVKYPHQLGIIFIFELIYRIFGSGNWPMIMALNVIAVAAIFNVMYKILTKIVENKKIYNFYWIMVFGCFPLIFYSFFVYGTIFGLLFSLLAVYYAIKFKETYKIKHFIIVFLFCVMAINAKKNYEIFIIAIFLVMLFHCIKEKKFKHIILTITLILTFMSPKLVTAYYSTVSGIEIGKGVPSYLHIAMGLQKEGYNGAWGAGGWYNGYNRITFENAGYDPDRAAQIGKDNIKERVEEFKNDPIMAAKFFGNKTVTQWCEPTFQVFWMSEAKNNHLKQPGITRSVMTGKINIILSSFMKIYLLFIWLGCFVYYTVNRKKMDIWSLIFAVIIVGGFAFSLFWEAKALYIMPYFVAAMIPGIQGIWIIYEKVRYRCSLFIKSKVNKEKGKDNE